MRQWIFQEAASNLAGVQAILACRMVWKRAN